jgi:threonine synthase
MDIQFAYNLERLLYYICNENHEIVKAIMVEFEATGQCKLDGIIHARIQSEFLAVSVSDQETILTMRGVWQESRYCLCPHSATAVFAADKFADQLGSKVVCVLTAHPAKFEDAVQEAIGQMPPTTPAVEALKTLPHKFERLRRSAGKDWVGVKEEWKNTLRAAVIARNDSATAVGKSRL